MVNLTQYLPLLSPRPTQAKATSTQMPAVIYKPVMYGTLSHPSLCLKGKWSRHLFNLQLRAPPSPKVLLFTLTDLQLPSSSPLMDPHMDRLDNEDSSLALPGVNKMKNILASVSVSTGSAFTHEGEMKMARECRSHQVWIYKVKKKEAKAHPSGSIQPCTHQGSFLLIWLCGLERYGEVFSGKLDGCKPLPLCTPADPMANSDEMEASRDWCGSASSVPPEPEEKLMNDSSTSPALRGALAANQGVVISLNAMPERGSPAKKPVVLANLLLSPDS
eukprot:jgi/Psemu1/1407/gm1.1407_g